MILFCLMLVKSSEKCRLKLPAILCFGRRSRKTISALMVGFPLKLRRSVYCFSLIRCGNYIPFAGRALGFLTNNFPPCAV